MSLELSGTTGVKGVAGSVSAPSIVGDDTNTGISFPAADTIKFSTGGVERMSITNSGVSGITAGITMADQWRVTSGFDSYNTIININWERQDTYSPGLIGSGMSESSGIFTFPTTGIYRIDFQSHAMRGSGAFIRYVGITIDVTTNNSNYNLVSNSYSSISNDDQAFAAMYCTTLFDVTDVSTHKVRFVVYAENTVSWEGDTSSNRTSVIFTRLGDT